MRSIDWMKRGLAALGLAGLGIAALAQDTSAPARQTAKPALWRVSDADTSIYLFGTIHLLPQNYEWQTGAIRKAVDKSSTLTVETLVDTQHPQEMMTTLAKLGAAPGLPPLANRINPAFRPQLAQAIATTGLPTSYFDGMKTWYAAFTLVQFQFKSIGLAGESGVEPNLRHSFESAGKSVGQLETNLEQLALFDTLSPAAQRSFLEDTISNPGGLNAEFDAMLKSWISGDVAGMARSFNADLASSPELRTALLTRRNQNWARWIEQRMAQPGTAMVAVGAGHLAGDESVIAMLQRDGFKVQRVE